MATVMLRDTEVHTAGELPAVGSTAPDFQLVRQDLSNANLATFKGKKILNIFPSVDTGVCATSVRTFNAKAGKMDGVSVLNVSADLPFAFKRFCGAEGLDGVETLSTFRGSFSTDYGTKLIDGGMAGLSARAVVVLDENNKVIYNELVPSIGQEPNYEAAIAAASK